jgi:hypothetical protein
MSNPYGPDIETMADWNRYLQGYEYTCACCSMPTPHAPVINYDTIGATITGYRYTHEGEYYLTERREWSEEGFQENSWSGPWETDLIPETQPARITDIEYTEDESEEKTGDPEPWTYSDPADLSAGLEDEITKARDYINGHWDTAPRPGSVSTYSSLDFYGVGRSGGASIFMTRYRFYVPVWHEGTYYKVTWDVLFEPYGWDDEGTALEERPLRYSKKNLTEEWHGPGSGGTYDESRAMGDWYTLDLPEEPGETRVINVRFTMFQDDPLDP